ILRDERLSRSASHARRHPAASPEDASTCRKINRLQILGTAPSMTKERDRVPPLLHIGVNRPLATLRRHPVDVLVGVLDVAGLAVHAILGVDDVDLPAILLHPLIDACRTITGRRTGINVMFGALLQLHVLYLKMHRLVLLMIGGGQEYRRQA